MTIYGVNMFLMTGERLNVTSSGHHALEPQQAH